LNLLIINQNFKIVGIFKEICKIVSGEFWLQDEFYIDELLDKLVIM